MILSTVLILIGPTGLAVAEEHEGEREPSAAAAVTLAMHAGPYWMVDREDRMFDGPSVALSAELAKRRGWGAGVAVGGAGELAGGRGTCLGELSVEGGPSFAFEPGPSWFHVVVRGGPGVVFARLYGSLAGAPPATQLAYGDRMLPAAWSSLGTAVSQGRMTLSLDLLARWVPPATFRADSVPAGARPDFYPTFRRDHDLSSYGVMAGFAFRL